MGFRPVGILMEIEGHKDSKFGSFRYRKLGDIWLRIVGVFKSYHRVPRKKVKNKEGRKE